jgi:FtsZ-binding cell division protein ZapB
LTSELERIKILEGKVSQVVEYINKLLSENAKLKQQLKDLKSEKKDFDDQTKRLEKLDEELKQFTGERKLLKEKIEAIIGQIDQVGI